MIYYETVDSADNDVKSADYVNRFHNRQFYIHLYDKPIGNPLSVDVWYSEN